MLRLLPLLALALLVPACDGGSDTIVISPPAPASGTAVALTTNNVLLFFDPAAPNLVVGGVVVTGLAAGETLVGIDFRPSTGQLYGMTLLAANLRIYRINLSSGLATQVGTTFQGTTGTEFGFDFTPVPDRIRVVSDAEDNFRWNPDSGILAGTDSALTPAGNVVGAAYTNNMPGAVQTTLYAIDSASDSLMLIGSINGTPTSPNNGTLTLVGALGVDTSARVGMDITPAGICYAVLEVTGVSGLYTINLTTGAATLVGTIGTGSPLRGLAIVP